MTDVLADLRKFSFYRFSRKRCAISGWNLRSEKNSKHYLKPCLRFFLRAFNNFLWRDNFLSRNWVVPDQIWQSLTPKRSDIKKIADTEFEFIVFWTICVNFKQLARIGENLPILKVHYLLRTLKWRKMQITWRTVAGRLFVLDFWKFELRRYRDRVSTSDKSQRWGLSKGRLSEIFENSREKKSVL